jgi:hypothetical protein
MGKFSIFFLIIFSSSLIFAQQPEQRRKDSIDSIINNCYKKGIRQIDSMANVREQNKIKQEKEIALKQKQAQEERKKNLISKYGVNNAEKIMSKLIWIGMTKEMARESWGEPKDIHRTVTASSIHEQWVYSGEYLYFENGILTSWQD